MSATSLISRRFIILVYLRLCCLLSVLSAENMDIKHLTDQINYIIPPYHYQPEETDDPLVSAMSFRAFCDHRVDYETEYFDPDSVNNGDSIYVAYHLLVPFIEEIHPKIKKPYILVTNESTADHPPKGTEILMYDPKCAAWFSKNMILSNHPKLFQIPVGQTCFEWPLIKPFLPYLVQLSTQNQAKQSFCFLRIDNTFLKTREEALHILKDKPFVHFLDKTIPPKDYYEQIATHQFVIAPHGGGYDTCRFWESLSLGSIPITTHSPLDTLYQDVPCIVVNSWSDLNKLFLAKSLERLQQQLLNGEISFEKAQFGYWKGQINQVQNKIRNGEWKGADLTQTLLSKETLNELKSVFNAKPPIQFYILGKGLSLRGIQYLSTFSSYGRVICLDEYLLDATEHLELMKNFSPEDPLWKEARSSLISYADLDPVISSILHARCPVHILLDLYYDHYQFEDILERIWKALPNQSIIAITPVQQDAIKAKLQAFMKKHYLSEARKNKEQVSNILVLKKNLTQKPLTPLK